MLGTALSKIFQKFFFLLYYVIVCWIHSWGVCFVSPWIRFVSQVPVGYRANPHNTATKSCKGLERVSLNTMIVSRAHIHKPGIKFLGDSTWQGIIILTSHGKAVKYCITLLKSGSWDTIIPGRWHPAWQSKGLAVCSHFTKSSWRKRLQVQAMLTSKTSYN